MDPSHCRHEGLPPLTNSSRLEAPHDAFHLPCDALAQSQFNGLAFTHVKVLR